jgi:hypothetical protein
MPPADQRNQHYADYNRDRQEPANDWNSDHKDGDDCGSGDHSSATFSPETTLHPLLGKSSHGKILNPLGEQKVSRTRLLKVSYPESGNIDHRIFLQFHYKVLNGGSSTLEICSRKLDNPWRTHKNTPHFSSRSPFSRYLQYASVTIVELTVEQTNGKMPPPSCPDRRP